MSSALANRDPVSEVCETIKREAFQTQLREALPAEVSIDRFTRVSLVAVQQNPELVSADRRSLFMALVTCARDGLIPDGREAALVMHKKKVSYLPMVGGFRKKAAHHGIILSAHAVYANDEFVFQLGTNPQVQHRPPQDLSEERGELRGAYAIATLRDGRQMVEAMSKGEIEHVRKSSTYDAVWKAHEAEMYRKTVTRRLFKSLPLGDLDERTRHMMDVDEAAVDEATAPVPELAGLPVEPDDALTGELVDEDGNPIEFGE